MIKSKEEYFKVNNLVIAMEDMSWLYKGVESSLNGLDNMNEAKNIKDALNTLIMCHDTLWKKMQEWEEDNNV